MGKCSILSLLFYFLFTVSLMNCGSGSDPSTKASDAAMPDTTAPDTTGPDTTAPSIPTNLVTTAISDSQINLTWTASFDDVGVTGYKIYRNGVYLKSQTTTSLMDDNLISTWRYCYQVTAYDLAGNESERCISMCETPLSNYIYSFEGVISALSYDGAGIIANEGYKIGDPVLAKFHVDFASNGYYLLNNGEMIIPERPALTNNPYWYFLSSMVDGTLMPVINNGLYNGPNDIKEYHYGYNNSGPTGNFSALKGGTGNSNFTIFKESLLDTSVQNWLVGDHLSGILVGCGDTDCSIVSADMILTDVRLEP